MGLIGGGEEREGTKMRAEGGSKFTHSAAVLFCVLS